MVIKLLYIIQHLSSILLLKKQTSKLFVFISILIYFFIYMSKSDTFDILAYTKAMSYPFIFEPGYAFISYWVNFFIADSRLSLFFIQVLLAILFFSLTKKTDKTIINISFVISSVAFILGVNNVIRQAFSSVFLIYSLFFLIEKKYLFSILVLIIAVLFHKSAILFYFFIFFSYFSYKFYLKIKIKKRLLPLGIYILFIFLCMVICVEVLWIILNSGFYEEYMNRNMAINNIRTILFIKVLALVLVFIVSEKLIKISYKRYNLLNIFRIQRMNLLILLLILSLNPGFNELGSRIMYFYYMIEMMLLIYLYQFKQKRAVVSILFFYAFALNAMNILGGT